MHKHPRILLIIDSSRALGRGLLRGIAKYSRHQGPLILFREYPIYANELKKKQFNLSDWDIDGIIVAEVQVDENMLDQIRKSGIPSAIKNIGNEVNGLCNIISENKSIGVIAARHFLDRGFKEFAYCGMTGLSWSEERLAGFSETLKEQGQSVINFNQKYDPSSVTLEEETEMISNWIKCLPKPIALFAGTDERGQHIIDICKDLTGIEVPRDVAVLGVDNDEIVCEISNPPLSSISRNFEKAGYEVASILHRIITHGRVEIDNIIMEPINVVTRESTNVLAIEDEYVAKSLAYIRENSNLPMNVDDIAAEVTISRRGLERRFRKHLNRSINDEIRRARLERVKRMLTETTINISEIAISMGYPGVNHVARTFKAQTGLTPGEYRKKFSNA